MRTVLYEWPYKYIHSSDEASELYHLEEDPKETRNRYFDEEYLIEDMENTIAAFKKSRGIFDENVEQAPLSKDEIDQLRSLGYIK